MVLLEFNKIEKENLIFSYFRFYRCILVCRIFRLCQYLEYMSFITEVIWKSFRLFFNLAFLFSIVITFFSLLGRQFFKSYFINENFDTFSTSFMCVFQIITLDNWYDIIISEPLDLQQVIYLSIYIVCLIFIGNYFFLNLFLTIIIDVFQLKQEQKNEETEVKNQKSLTLLNNNASKSFDKRRKAISNKTPKLELEINHAINSIRKQRTGYFEEIEEEDENDLSSDSLNSESLSNEDLAEDRMKVLEKFVNKMENREMKKESDYCFYIIPPDNFLRAKVKSLVENIYFIFSLRVTVWIHLILKGLDTLFIERRFFYTNEVYESFSTYLELLIFIYFTFEIIMKIFAYGLIIGPQTFLQRFSNIFNTILVLAYYMGMNATKESFTSYVKIFRNNYYY